MCRASQNGNSLAWRYRSRREPRGGSPDLVLEGHGHPYCRRTWHTSPRTTPHVAVHVVETPGGALGTASRKGVLAIHTLLAAAVDGVTAVVHLVRADGRADIERRGRFRAARIFPFRFGREPHRPARLSGNGSAERDGIFPGDHLRRVRRALEAARVVPHDYLILPLRHLVDAHVDRPADRYPVLWALVTVPLFFVAGRAHQEAPGMNADEFHRHPTANIQRQDTRHGPLAPEHSETRQGRAKKLHPEPHRFILLPRGHQHRRRFP